MGKVRRWSNENIQEWLNDNAHGYKLSSNYKKHKSKLKITCPKGHEYETTWNSFYRGFGRCGACKSLDKLVEIQAFLDKRHRGYIIKSDEFVNISEDLVFSCVNGHEFKMSLNRIEQIKTTPCKQCREDASKEEFLQYLKEETNGYVYLNPEEWSGVSGKAKLVCPEGHEVEMLISGFKSGKRCKFCAAIKRGKSKRLSYEYVKAKIETEKGYRLLSDKYESSTSILTIMCDKGHIYDTRYSIFYTGSRCPFCNGGRSFTHSEVKHYIEVESGSGYKLITKEYTAETRDNLKMECNRGHEITMTFGNFRSGHRCQVCMGIDNRGENHYNYKGGISPLNKVLRESLYEWKHNSLEGTNYKCDVSGKGGYLEVHHKYSFNKILEDTISQLGLSARETIGDYSKEEISLIRHNFLDYHDKNLGAPLLKPIHSLYHYLYGDDNNETQYLEFKKRYSMGEFNRVL